MSRPGSDYVGTEFPYILPYIWDKAKYSPYLSSIVATSKDIAHPVEDQTKVMGFLFYCLKCLFF